jgi:hypothetical protein
MAKSFSGKILPDNFFLNVSAKHSPARSSICGIFPLGFFCETNGGGGGGQLCYVPYVHTRLLELTLQALPGNKFVKMSDRELVSEALLICQKQSCYKKVPFS